jgi:hypothetical protein
LKRISDKPTTAGRKEVADATPKLIDKLERDLKKLEKALETKSEP